jgi:hypothetical protein
MNPNVLTVGTLEGVSPEFRDVSETEEEELKAVLAKYKDYKTIKIVTTPNRRTAVEE